MSSNLFQRLLGEFALLFDPLQDAATSSEARRRLLATLGWDLEVVDSYPLEDLVTRLGQLAETARALSELPQNPPQTLDEVVGILGNIGSTFDTLQQISELAASVQPTNIPDLGPALQQLGSDMAQLLVVIYLDQHQPLVFQLARLLTLAQAPVDVPGTELVAPLVEPTSKLVLRYPVAKPSLRLERISELLTDPVAHLRSEYLINDLADEPAARAAAERLFGRLASVLRELNIDSVVGADADNEKEFSPAAQSVISRSLTFLLPADLSSNTSGSVGATLTLLPQTEGGPAVGIVPVGELKLTTTTASWNVEIDVAGAASGFAVGRGGLTLPPGVSGKVHGAIRCEQVIEELGQPVLVIGSTTGTRLELGELRAGLEFTFDGKHVDLQLLLEIISAAVAIAAGEGDGFLQKVLPKEGLRTDFDLAVGWSNRKGLYFRGSAGLEATLPVHKSILGVLTVESIYLALRTQEIESGAQDPAIETVAAATAKVALGPFKASVERIGLLGKITFPKEGGNLGPANLALGFKPPDGAGMVIDAEAIVGGGYLEFDRKNEQYAGILQLEVKGGIALKAIGLLSTRMPDGSKGFSLLVIITAEFPPIQLGYGFTLSGVGGLLGVHRTMVIDVLRAGVKNRTLDSILFPKNPVENATKIISDLRGVFPVASGRFVFGPMAILGWGAPTILTLELGILIELPAPVRVALLGTLTMILPEEKAPAVVVHMDVLGVLDFDKGDVSIDATLYDSRIAVFALTGDMALRASWGASPTFALSAGGFNPRFQPPPAFPSLDRLALTLATGDNPRLRLEAYLALTSNTAQLGARVDLYAEQAAELLGVKKTFSVEAYLGFDTLIHFSPFGLIADIGAQATVKLDGEPLFQVAVNMTLTGPEPWHAWGEATFEFLGKRRIPFDVTVGQPAAAELPPPPDPLERLRVALADRRNWSAQLPSSGHMLVTLRQIEAGKVEILVHPLGDLTVRQREVPLEVEIARFGSLPLPARKKYKIEKIELGTHQPALKENQQVRDAFAPGQFFEMSDDEKLSRPAFQPLPSGYTRLGVTGTEYPSSAARTATFHYDTVVIDKKDEVAPRHEAAYALAPQLMSVLAERGAAAESPMRQTGSARFAGPSQKVVVKEPAYAVANTEDLAVEATAMSYIEAETARAEMGGDGAGWQVVGAHEVEG